MTFREIFIVHKDITLKWLNMNMTINIHVLICSIVAIYSMYQDNKIVILFWFLDFIHFKTLNVHYSKTTCLIEFKLTESIVQVNKRPYIHFQVILKFYKNIGIFYFKGHSVSYGPVSM